MIGRSGRLLARKYPIVVRHDRDMTRTRQNGAQGSIWKNHGPDQELFGDQWPAFGAKETKRRYCYSFIVIP
jgi:hypothetical protein